MSGIFVAAGITTVLVLCGYGAAIWVLSAPADRPYLLLALLLVLPLHPLAFYAVRLPIDQQVSQAVSEDSTLYQLILLLYAPLTEEPAKLLPLLLPMLRRRITSENFLVFGMTLGFGFGIGELWMLAERASRVSEVQALPFYAFGGFLIERAFVCFLHGAFTSVVLARLSGGWLWGLLGAMGLHMATNAPLALQANNVGSLSEALWEQILWAWLVCMVVVMMLLLLWLRLGNSLFKQLVYATCPECGAAYKRPLLGLNFGLKRYERCPVCGKFHWTSLNP